MITLNAAQRARKSLIVRHINREISTRDMAITLNMTQRNARRITAEYKRHADVSLVHGNTGRKRQTLEQEVIKEKIEYIYTETTYNGTYLFRDSVTFASFRDILEEDHGINVSKGYLRKIITSLGYKSPKPHRNNEAVSHLFVRAETLWGNLYK